MAEKVKVNWTKDAFSEVGEIYAYIFDASIAYANSWYEELEEKIKLLESFPQIGKIVPEKQLKYLREVAVGSYRMLYIYLNNEITIITLKHQSEDLGKLI